MGDEEGNLSIDVKTVRIATASETGVEMEEDPWEIHWDRVILGDLLGQGAFGMVLKAKLLSSQSSAPPMIVAVKILKGIFFFNVLRKHLPITVISSGGSSG